MTKKEAWKKDKGFVVCLADDKSEDWVVLGDESDYCYGKFGSKSEANAKKKELMAMKKETVKESISSMTSRVQNLQESVATLRRGAVQILSKITPAKLSESIARFNSNYDTRYQIASNGLVLDHTRAGDVRSAKTLGTYLMREGIKNKTVLGESFRILFEDELEQAEVILAARDMLDTLQKMVEDLAKLSTEELLPIVDQMKVVFGTDKATEFENTVSEKISSALEQLRNTKDTMTNEILRLEGKEVQQSSNEPSNAGMMDNNTDGEEMDNTNPGEVDFSQDEGDDDSGETEQAPQQNRAPALGRDKR